MLTSIRGLTVASISAGVLLSATPAFANETSVDPNAVDSLSGAAALDQSISPELMIAAASLADREAGISLVPDVDRASEPVDVAASSGFLGEAGFTFSANVALVTEYRFRGVDLSGSEIAIQGGFDVNHSSGFYAGTWASSLDEDTVGYGSTELDLYGGWSGNLTEGLSTDIGFIAYTYPDAPPGEFDYYEFYGSLSFSLGPVSTTGGIAYAPGQNSLDFGGGTDDNLYLYTDVSVGIPTTPITVTGHLGYTDGSLTFTNDGDAFDWSIGAEANVFGPITVGVAYIGIEGSPSLISQAFGLFNFTKDQVVGTLSASF
ncbi:TorF family putative porin [Erythrobacter ani]|uniref:TorF family putative porin n=1 Tax=Erythrobacter ani TaxID=2827235 RepID=A0ABS6SIY6_9SPHN|nr:TorF family putative porin [Erythrobacter ani]MBV7264959.1 TorF family putative porin [Erythrobacter ani]